MNQKQLESALLEFREKLIAWPIGTVVWHRSTGQKGIVTGCQMCGDGHSMTVVQWGASQYGMSYDLELSKSRVATGEDGEDWKEVESQ